jgi:hypothetical protein
MPRIEYHLDIQAPIEKVYEISQDYSIRYEWDPFPDNIALLNGATGIIKTQWWSIPFLSERISSWYFNAVIRARLLGLKRYCENTKL